MVDDDQYRWIADEHRYLRLARIALSRVPELKSLDNEDALASAISDAVGKWFAGHGKTDPLKDNT